MMTRTIPETMGTEESASDYISQNEKHAGGSLVLEEAQSMLDRDNPSYTGNVSASLSFEMLSESAREQRPKGGSGVPTYEASGFRDTRMVGGAYPNGQWSQVWLKANTAARSRTTRTFIARSFTRNGAQETNVKTGVVTLILEVGKKVSTQGSVTGAVDGVTCTGGVVTLSPPVPSADGVSNHVNLIPTAVSQLNVSEDGSAGALGQVEAIRFSRWFGAYPNAAPFTRKTDWIKHDPDRFVLQIPSAYFPNTATTTAKLSTQAPAGLADAATYEDNATDITLTLNAAGSYLESKPMILVTNQEDADEEKNGNGGINNQLDDPTHIGWMGGTLELEFTDHRKAAFPIAASKKKVVLDSLIVDATGSSTFANVSAAFTKQAKLAREIFAQDLIQLDTPTPKSVPFTGAVYDALFDSSSADDPQGNLFVFSALTDSFGSECAAVLAQCRALFERPQNSIRVLYLPAESYTWFESNFRYKFEDLGALTFDSSQWPSNHPAPVLGADNGTILMNSKAAAANSPVLYGAMGMTTLAHEIGHALGLAHVSENSPQNGTPTPNDPWHRLMLRLPDKTQDPLNNKRFSPAEHSKFFGATPSPHFQSPSVQ